MEKYPMLFSTLGMICGILPNLFTTLGMFHGHIHVILKLGNDMGDYPNFILNFGPT